MQRVERLKSNTNAKVQAVMIWLMVLVKEGAAWEERRKQGESERVNSRK